MAANLTAVFELVDRISGKLDAIASRGDEVVGKWESIGNAADEAFEEIGTAASSVVSAVSSYSTAANDAAGTTDYWTDAIGDYSKSTLEAIYSTQELVDMGYKQIDALLEEQSVMELAKMATDDLNAAMNEAVNVNDKCAEAIGKAAEMSEKAANSDKVSKEAKAALQEATEKTSQAFEELKIAQTAAETAMNEYNSVAERGTASITELEAAALKAAQAADKLAAANEKVTSSTEELAKATEEASEEEEQNGNTINSAIGGIASALAGAGITDKVKEIAEEVYNLANAFSDAESTVVLATGATGEALDGLTNSMMKAYAASKTGSLDETAAAVGEINTRLAYTGDKLTETTELFLDFAAVTGGNAASSVKSVTQLMNQWDVPATNMEMMLSKLTYAGQASGIGVDTLSSSLTSNKAILDQLGFSLDEAIAMFMKFELAGTNSTAVMTGFRTALSSGAISSLEELYEVFDEISSGVMTAAEASELFGSRAGPAIVNAVNEGTFSLDEMVSALENADGTLGTTAEAAQTLDQKWEQATNNVGAAFTNALSPAINKASSGMASFVNLIGDFLNEHPAVVKGISAAAAVIGVAVAAFGVYTVVQGIATAATALFGTTLSAAIWPVTLVVGAIAAVVGVVVALTSAFGKAEDETANMTAVTKQQYYQLQDLNAEYERACEAYGENSEEALRLQYQIDDLSEAFENNRQTLEEFQAEVDDLCNSVNDLWTEFDKSISEINANETGTLALIQKYEDLAEKAELTAGEQKQLEAVTRSLADQFPDLAAKVDAATLSTEDYIEALKKSAQVDADKQRQQEAQAAYVEALKKQAELEEEIAKAEENLRLETEAFNNTEWAWWSDQAFYQATGGWLGGWTNDIDEYQAALDELKAAQEENNAEVAKLERNFEALAEKEQEAAEEAVSYADACAGALESVKERVDNLCIAYDEAYQSALDSFQGQFGLFDEASMKSEDYLNATVANAQKALDSQVAYWEEYNANLETLTAYGEGLTGEARENYEQLLTYAQSGNEEAAGLAASIADAINSGNDDAVNKLSETVGKVAAQQEAAAAKTAEFKTNFNEEMEDILSDMGEYVSKLGFEDEATKAAASTMISYAQSIRQGKNEAIQAASEVADAVSAAIRGSVTSTNINISQSASVPGHARGTTNAEDVFVAGENGPELIVGAGGSTVFPHSETDRIIDAISEPAEQSVKVVNEYEPTSFIDKIENFFTRLMGKFSSVFDGAARGNAVELEAYANGTTASDKNFIAGENGPELILNQPDSTVFPSDETDRIINAIDATYNRDTEQGANYDYPVPATANTERSDGVFVPVGNNWNAAEGNSGNSDTNTKKITLEIAGKGNIELSGGKPDKESLLAFLYEYLKPVLSDIIAEEVYEEGDLSYEY